MAWRRVTATVIWAAQAQRSARRSRRRRPLLARRPATAKSRRRSRFRLPAAGLPGQGEHLRPGQEFTGQRDDLAPDLVLREPLQRQVPQPGVLRRAYPVLAPCPPAMPQLQVSQMALLRIVAKQVNRCPSISVDRNCAPGCGRSLRTMTRIPPGQPPVSSRPVMSATQPPSRTSPSPS